MKPWLLLCLLLPLCIGVTLGYAIQCYGEDFLMVRNKVLTCKSQVQQACYTRKSGEKGCVKLDYCQKPGWTCCDTNLCNA